MALTNDIWDIRAFAHVAEAVEGVDQVPDPMADAVVLHNGTVAVQTDERILNRDQPDGGGRPSVLVMRRGQITGGIELIGAATAGTAAPIGRVLRTGGFQQTLVNDAGPPAIAAADYTPILRGFPSGTSYFWHDGEWFQLVGVRGALESISMAINEFPMGQYTSLGPVNQIDEAAVPETDISDYEIPEVGTEANMSVMIDGNLVEAVSLEISSNINLNLKYSTEATRSRHTARDWNGTLRIYRPEIVDADIRSIARSRAMVPVLVDYQHPDDEARHLSLLGPTCQLGEPQLVDIDGGKGWDVPIKYVRFGQPEMRLRFGGEVVT